jgi:hypothetical protein
MLFLSFCEFEIENLNFSFLFWVKNFEEDECKSFRLDGVLAPGRLVSDDSLGRIGAQFERGIAVLEFRC